MFDCSERTHTHLDLDEMVRLTRSSFGTTGSHNIPDALRTIVVVLALLLGQRVTDAARASVFFEQGTSLGEQGAGPWYVPIACPTMERGAEGTDVRTECLARFSLQQCGPADDPTLDWDDDFYFPMDAERDARAVAVMTTTSSVATYRLVSIPVLLLSLLVCASVAASFVVLKSVRDSTRGDRLDVAEKGHLKLSV